MTENNNAPGNAGAKSNGVQPDHNQQNEYSTNDNVRELLDQFLKHLSPELAKKVNSAVLKEVTEDISNGGNDPKAEALLPGLKLIKSSTILTTEYPQIPWIIPELLPPGLSFLAGKPKVGKSWMALQLALSVLTGGKMFDKSVASGKVLYLALEDSERRLQGRMQKQGWPISASIDLMFYDVFMDQIGALNSGGGKRLLAYIEKNKYRLVIIDTFTRSIRGDQLDSSDMKEALSPIQHYAMKADIAILFIHHMPKATPNIDTDPIGHLYGSVAISGIGDNFWALYKEPRKYGAKLAITGRDMESLELKLSFEREGFYWHSEGDANQIEITERRKEILEYLEEAGRSVANNIAEATGQDRRILHGRLQDLTNSGLIIKTKEGEKIFYSLNNNPS